MSGDLTFPFYSWIRGCNDWCSSTFSKDISYSGSRIDRTYWTFVNQGTTGDPTYEIPCADYLWSGGGMWAFHNMKWCMIDVQGQKYPSSDGLTEADASIYKAYTEWLQ